MSSQPTATASMPRTDARLYLLCGFTVRSELALPELHELDAGALAPGAAADLDIGFAPVPETLAGADMVRDRFACRGGDEILVSHAAIGRLLLTRPGTVRIDPVRPAVESDLRALLFGPLLGAFVHMRGLLPLHASAVRFGDGAVAFTGVSGAGKSTLAAFLADRGHQILADDVCVLDGGADGPIVRPSLSRLKLWGASMDALGKPRLEAHRDTLRWEKYHLRQAPAAGALPLRAIVALDQAAAGGPALERLAGSRAIAALLGNVYRPLMARGLGRTTDVFRQAGGVAGAVPVHRLTRRWDLDGTGPVVDLLQETWGAA